MDSKVFRAHQLLDAAKHELERKIQQIQAQANHLIEATKTLEELDLVLASKITEYSFDEPSIEVNLSTIKLNFGGECVSIKRDIICNPSVEGNFFSGLFHPRWEKVLPRDKNGNIYLEWDFKWVQPILDAYEIAYYYSNSLMADIQTNKRSTAIAVEPLSRYQPIGEVDTPSRPLTKQCISFLQSTLAIDPFIQVENEQTRQCIEEVLGDDSIPLLHTLRNLCNEIFTFEGNDTLHMNYVPFNHSNFMNSVQKQQRLLLLTRDETGNIVGFLWHHRGFTSVYRCFAFVSVLSNDITQCSTIVVGRSLLSGHTIESPGTAAIGGCGPPPSGGPPQILPHELTVTDAGIVVGVSAIRHGAFSRGPHFGYGTTTSGFGVSGGFNTTTPFVAPQTLPVFSMTLDDAVTLPHQSSTFWTKPKLIDGQNLQSLPNSSTKLERGIAMFIIEPKSIAASNQPSSSQQMDTQATTDQGSLYLNSCFDDAGLEYQKALQGIDGAWYNRLDETLIVQAVAQQKSFSSLHCNGLHLSVFPSNDITTKVLQSCFDDITKSCNAHSTANDIIWFNVRGKSVCLYRSTILSIIPNSQLATRLNGKWTEQQSTLDEEGRIIIKYPSQVFLPFVEYLRARSIFAIKSKIIGYPNQELVNIANDMLDYFLIDDIRAVVCK